MKKHTDRVAGLGDTAMSDAELIAKARELDAKATKGPWSSRKDYFDRNETSRDARYEVFPHTNGLKRPEDGVGDWTALASCESYEPKNKANADFIAAARTLLPDLANRLEAARKAIEWQPIETAPRDGTVFLGYSEEWIDADFCPDGIRECFLNGGPGPDGIWTSAKWDNCNDTWWPDEETKPTHWMPLPTPPALPPTQRNEH